MLNVILFVYVLIGCGGSIYVSGIRLRNGRLFQSDQPSDRDAAWMTAGFAIGSAIFLAAIALSR